ncbi:hypothetical protein NA57DRAFT_57316 [Rhizodiscina lignyota]|uniref:Uncharacterized protein n=1 Tax=Rhizodiscina lignyota TaxID=1504668 RepID=A0A9P4IAA8_9PEZI|nr:hypothetical protein NA57DRAFT_57316 [Rhizodiscina lignyota]
MSSTHFFAYFLGTTSISIGLIGLTLPKFASYRLFGVPFTAIAPPSSSPVDATSPREQTSEHPAAAYLAAKSVRDIALGISYFTFAMRSDWGPVRVVAAAHCFVGWMDAIIVRFWPGGVKGKEWGHAIGTTVLAACVWTGTGF